MAHCALIRAILTAPLKRMVQQALIPNSSYVYIFRTRLTEPLRRKVHCALIRASLTSPLKRMVQQALIPLIKILFKGRLARQLFNNVPLDAHGC